MKSLSIWQPWSWAIASGRKTIENRGWQTYHRGPLAVHAAKNSGTKLDLEHALARVAELSGLDPAAVADACTIRGAVVAVATLTDVCTDSYRWGFSSPLHCGCGPWAQSGSRHFVLTDIRPLRDPVPVRGGQGLWDLPGDVEAAVLAQLGQEVAQ